MFTSFSILFCFGVAITLLNYKWLKLPITIAQALVALVTAVIVIASRPIAPDLYDATCSLITDIDFSHSLLEILLGFLLFGGAIHVKFNDLFSVRIPVLLFATIGVLTSTFLVGTIMYYVLAAIGLPISLVHCYLFGALISPTDPIAVLSILKTSTVSKSLQTKIEGESLFNDGIGIIVFSAILIIAQMSHATEGGHSLSSEIMLLFFEEVVIGILLGLVFGFLAAKLIMMYLEDHYIPTMISLAAVVGGYSLAISIHSSGPLAMVVAGLIVGNQINKIPSENQAKINLKGFWHIIDESLNGILFIFLGIAIHLVNPQGYKTVLVVVIPIVVVLICRFISVLLPYSLLKHDEDNWLHSVYILTWGGLKGGISLALALSLTIGPDKEIINLMTYAVVIFSVIFQGLTISKLVKKLTKSPA